MMRQLLHVKRSKNETLLRNFIALLLTNKSNVSLAPDFHFVALVNMIIKSFSEMLLMLSIWNALDA
jgi:hypothetical protein